MLLLGDVRHRPMLKKARRAASRLDKADVQQRCCGGKLGQLCPAEAASAKQHRLSACRRRPQAAARVFS